MHPIPKMNRAQIHLQHDTRKRAYLVPKAVVVQSDTVENAQALLHEKPMQMIEKSEYATLHCEDFILLDFGVELHGSIAFSIFNNSLGKNMEFQLRITLGESVGEALSQLGENGAGNDHAVRDALFTVPGRYGYAEFGMSGFRFAKIQLVSPDAALYFSSIQAVLIYQDLPYLGSFLSDNTLLNDIWETAAYTAHLNVQQYVWDGIKRDRLVWIGDLHPEVQSILSVFGAVDAIPESLTFLQNQYAPGEWMNNIPSYSLWWVLVVAAWFEYTADTQWLLHNSAYLEAVILNVAKHTIAFWEQQEPLDTPFLDWPSSDNKEASRLGVWALLALALQEGIKLCAVAQKPQTAQAAQEALHEINRHPIAAYGNKQSAALLALAGLADLQHVADTVLCVGGAHGFSSFLGTYVLEALGRAGLAAEGLKLIVQYWGGMLSLGATTFWEDFDVNWLNQAQRIDELPGSSAIDVHASYGDYCYKGYRHSLCHGWASGPASWLLRWVLGIKIAAPGCKVLKLEPELGTLQYVKGSMPTPLGTIYVSHRRENGSIYSMVKCPASIELVVRPDLNCDVERY